MSKPSVSLPTEQALWTGADVEKYLAEKGPEAVYGRASLEAWAEQRDFVRADNLPVTMRIPAATVPELAALTDPTATHRDCASVYLHPKAGAMLGTDTKVLMRVAGVDAKQAAKRAIPRDALTVIPEAAGRTAYHFDAHALLRLCLSALASVGGAPTSQSHRAMVVFLPHATDPNGPWRVEVATDMFEVRMVGCIVPIDSRGMSPKTDPNGLRGDTAGKTISQTIGSEL